MKTEIIGAIVMWLIVIVAVLCVAGFLTAGILYAEGEFLWAFIISAMLSVVITAVQIVGWYRAQPTPRHLFTTMGKEPILGVAMYYPVILGGVSLGALVLLENDPDSGLNGMYVTMVLVQQTALTGTTWLMFGERLRKRIPPGQPNQPAGARKEDKQMPVALALLALLSVVSVLAVFASTKKGNKRRCK